MADTVSQGGKEVSPRGSLTGRECWDTTVPGKLQNNQFPVTHSWGVASRAPQPPH